MPDADRADLFAPEPGPEASEPGAARRPRAWWGAAGGVFLLGLSICFMLGGLELGLGMLFRPGTGAFPFFTGLLVGALSLAIIAQDLRDFGPGGGPDGVLAERPDWVSFAAICGALMVFAASADRLGLVPAAFLTTLAASAPDRSLGLPGKLALGAAVGLGSWILFIEALGLPFKPIAGI